jgi:hypothetical protein
MTFQLSEYFLFEKGGTKSLPKVFVHNNCELIYFLFYFIAFSQNRNEKQDSFYTAKHVSSWILVLGDAVRPSITENIAR